MGRLIIATLILVGLISTWTMQDETKKTSLYKELKDLPEILDLIDRAYVDDKDIASLLDGALQGVLDATDPSASFIPPNETALVDPWPVAIRTGLVLSRNQSGIYIRSVFVDSPAWNEGLRPNMYLVSVNGTSLKQQPLHMAQAYLSNQQPLAVIAETENGDSVSINILPAKFDIPQAAYSRKGAGCVFALPSFINLPGVLGQAMSDLQNLKFLVLDLRGNALPDDEGLAQLGSFIFPQGIFAELHSRHGTMRQYVNQIPGPGSHLQVYCLVDGTTSTSAEALVAAMKDAKCGVIMGQSTLGQSYHYQPFTLQNGGQVVVSTLKMVFPQNTQYLGTGIEPHFQVIDEEDMLQRAISMGQQL
ncbi:MAG: hypothetical protein KDC35_15555 [Acidobacteria bacterium]|nr:hypothetical protein [Acidobacteriota bacterium]